VVKPDRKILWSNNRHQPQGGINFMRNHERSRLNIFLATVFGLLFVVSSGWAQTSEQKNNTAHVGFTDVPLKEVIKNLAKQLKINLVFDESFRDIPKYNLELEGVSLESALKIVFVQNHLTARVIEANTIIVFYNNESNRTLFASYSRWPEKTEKNQ
jgi:type II secretory pathway component GspD/PulD (secretin)